MTAGLCLAAAVGIEAYDFLTSKLDERMQRKAAEKGPGGRKPPGSRAWYRLSPEGRELAYLLVGFGGLMGLAASVPALDAWAISPEEMRIRRKIWREYESSWESRGYV